MNLAFRIHQDDNVATLLQDAEAGPISITGEGPCEIVMKESISGAHKVAVVPIPSGGTVIKYGWPIGHATRAIAPGEWVHLHNMASNYDERSSTLDPHTGSPTDTVNAYV